MFRAFALVFVLPLAALAQEPPAKKPLARQLTVLHEKKVQSFGETSIKDMTLGAMKDKLEREFKDDEFRIIIREDLFRIAFPGDVDKEEYSKLRFKLDFKPNGLTVHDFLTVALADANAVYLVRKGYIEITTSAAAVAEYFPEGNKLAEEKPSVTLAREPLVSHASTEQTVYDAARQIAFRYGKVVAFDPSVGTRRNKTVSPHWTNLPFPTAIRLLALEAGLDVKETRGVLTLTTAGRKKKGK